MHKFQTRVLSQSCVGTSARDEDLYHLKFAAPDSVKQPVVPGQFIQVYSGGANSNLLLPRPFSLFHFPSGGKLSDSGRSPKTWEILYRVVGKGTSWLSQRKTGDDLEILGPLGRGFSLPSFNSKGSFRPERILLVAGGIGMPPLFALAQRLARLKTQVSLFYAGKTRDDLVFLNKWHTLVTDLHLATEDGSTGFSGLVTDLLQKELKQKDADFYYACGPRPMLKAVQTLMKSKAIPGELSLEERMACGVGACLGCVTKTTRGYKRVCRDGPVFPADEVIFDD